ncbi:MAG: NAD(P)H-hydrate epimerase [Phycisphaerales bacterium]|nr:MAG: NAD(P)H-hydrate epimerase [Phycisphaerales bacterium]
MTELMLTRDQVRLVDRLAVERFGLTGLVLMENAGRSAAEIIRRCFPRCSAARIVCGSGNNGGDGCVIARHLHNAGWQVEVLAAGRRDRFSHDAAVNLGIVEAIRLPRLCTAEVEAQIEWVRRRTSDEAVLVDALLGTGFSGQVRADAAALIDALNRAPRAAVVAVDVPSGLDCQTGQPSNATVRADLTITFVANKSGLLEASAAPFVGRIEVADIGVPRQLIADVAAGRG